MIALNGGDAATRDPPISSAPRRPSPARRRSGSTSSRPSIWPATSSAALASLDRALAIDPYYVPAVLMKAELLERLGRRGGMRWRMFRAIIAAGPSARQPARAGARGARARARAGRGRRRPARGRARAARSPRSRPPIPDADFQPGHGLCRAADRAAQGLCAAAGRRPFPLSAGDRILSRASIFPGSPRSRRRPTRSARELLAAAGRAATAGFRPYVAFDPTQPANQWAELNH